MFSSFEPCRLFRSLKHSFWTEIRLITRGLGATVQGRLPIRLSSASVLARSVCYNALFIIPYTLKIYGISEDCHLIACSENKIWSADKFITGMQAKLSPLFDIELGLFCLFLNCWELLRILCGNYFNGINLGIICFQCELKEYLLSGGLAWVWDRSVCSAWVTTESPRFNCLATTWQRSIDASQKISKIK
jgi:hypothetical protein